MSHTKWVTSTQMAIGDLRVQVVRKPIKHLHLYVYPPDGQICITVPHQVNDDKVRQAIVSRLSWIKKQQAAFQAQPCHSQPQIVSGESHSVWGQCYRLEVIEQPGRDHLEIKNNTTLQLWVSPGTSLEKRTRILREWYRDQLKARIPDLLNHWQSVMGQEVSAWGVKQMKTRWGSCNIHQRRIWLNLELAKKPPQCLEYVLVHELVHLLERNHNDRFSSYMNQYLPQWQDCHDLLKRHLD